MERQEGKRRQGERRQVEGRRRNEGRRQNEGRRRNEGQRQGRKQRRDRKRRRDGERRRNRATGGESPADLSPVLDIARYDERHHYGRHSVERRQERLADRRRKGEREPEAGSQPDERRYDRYGSQF